MTRSGALPLSITVLAALLAGCTATPPAAAPSAETPAPEPTATAACPAGLASALEEFLASKPFGDALPDEVRVTEFPSLRFDSELVAGLADCVLGVEREFADGIQMQLFGIADVGREQILEALDAAGWEQPFPDTDPRVWQIAEGGASVGLYPGGTSEEVGPALGFPGWTDFLGPDEVVLESGIAF